MTVQTPGKRQATRRPYDAMRRSTCGNCPVGCGVKAFIEDDRLVDLFGDEDHPTNKGSFCPKGLLSLLLLDHPDRVLRPRIREDISQPFRAVDWPEALAFVARRLADLTARHGADSCVVHADDAAPFGHFFGASQFAARLGTRNRPDRFRPSALGNRGRIAEMFGVEAGRLLMNSQRDWAFSRCVLLVGSDPAATDPVTLGPLVDVRDRGGSLVVIDSNTTMTALKASYFVRVHPGTEAVLLAAVANLLIGEGHVDQDFIDEATRGFETFRDAVAPYTPAHAAAACRIGEDDVLTLARVIGDAHPMQVMCGDWSTRAGLDDELLGLSAAIVCLRGSIGIPGGGLNLLNTSPFFSGTGHPATLDQMLMREDAIVSALFCYGDPVARLSGGEAVRRKLAEVPLVVHIGGCDDETSHYIHAQLPPTTWLEESGLAAPNNGRAVQWRHAVVAPRGDCRPTLDIWADLARACGLDGAQEWEAARGDALARAAADFALSGNSLTSAMSVDALDPEATPPGGILWPCSEADDIAYEDDRFIRGDVRGRNILFRRHSRYAGAAHRFPTADGRINLGCAAPVSPAVDGDTGGADGFRLVASVAVDYINGWSGCVPTPGRPPVGVIARLHPGDADRLELRNGAPVLVGNENGQFQGTVEISGCVAPGVVWCLETPGRAPDGIGPFALFEATAPGEPRAPYATVTLRQKQ